VTRRPTIVLFDVDGTLVTTPGCGRRALERAFTARYGVVHQSITLKGIDSLAEARKRGLAKLAQVMKPARTLSFTHPGVIGIRRGQALRLRDWESGAWLVVWVQEVRHSVSAGDYSIEVTVQFTDPFKMTAADKRAEKRFKAAQAKNRKAAAAKRKSKPKPSKRARARAAA